MEERKCNPMTIPLHCANAFSEISGDIKELRAVTLEAIKRVEQQTTKTNGSVTELFARTEANAKDIAVLDTGATTAAADRKTWGDWRRTIAASVIIGIIMLLIGLSAGGCASSAGDISKQASEVVRLSALVTQAHRNALESVEKAKATVGVPDAAIVHLEAATGEINTASGHNTAMADAARKVQARIPKIEDKASALGEFFGEAFTIVKMVLGVVFVVAFAILGLWIIRRFGYLLPKAKRDEAQLARAVLSDDDPTTAREYVAARRASDPQLNTAMQKIRPPPAE